MIIIVELKDKVANGISGDQILGYGLQVTLDALFKGIAGQ
jgi:hypothetical protein